MYIKLLQQPAAPVAQAAPLPADRTPPFKPGDRVFYKPAPAGLEVVTAVEWSGHGWGGWHITTKRGPDLCEMTRFAPADDFHQVWGTPADPPLPGQRLAPRRSLRLMQLAAAATVSVMAWAAIWVAVAGLAR
jgi:hypothetical protein